MKYIKKIKDMKYIKQITGLLLIAGVWWGGYIHGVKECPEAAAQRAIAEHQSIEQQIQAIRSLESVLAATRTALAKQQTNQ